MPKHIYSYLALGDSYTIGEAVPLFESFPYQTIYLLRKMGFPFHAPEIVAKTGFTSFELIEQLLHTPLPESFDFVTFLIGVNNQYRGLAIDEFKEQCTFLAQKALHFTGGQANRIIMLSIPDWGATPFAEDRNRKEIAQEILAFNAVVHYIALQKKIQYIDITETTRAVSGKEDYLAADNLHYSGKLYALWAKAVSQQIAACLL